MASAERPRGFGSNPPTGSGQAGLEGRHIIVVLEPRFKHLYKMILKFFFE